MLTWFPGLEIALSAAALVAAATCARVWRGGTTLNDHFVAAVVAGCVAVYPALWWGALTAGVDGARRVVLAAALSVGALSVYGLFHVLDRRADPGPWMHWARLSQPAYAFALWSGLLLLFWMPWAMWAGRSLLWPGWWMLLPLGLALYGTAWTYRLGPAVREHVLPGGAHHAATGGDVRVVHLSDLHVGPTMPRSSLERLVDQVNGLEPDLVVITGDLVMPYSEQEHGFLAPTLGRLIAPAFACVGNHDLPVKDQLREELAEVGIALLVDEVHVVEVGRRRIEVAGVDFHWRDARSRLAAAVEGLPQPQADWRLLMAHDPRLFAWLPDGRFDLVLSGHTHGGQVGTDMFGVGWSMLRPLGVFDQGFWRRAGSLLYVHRGNWHTGLPPRMGIAPEVVVHRLGAKGSPPAARRVPDRVPDQAPAQQRA